MRLVRVIFYILKGVFILDINFNEIYINNTCPLPTTMCVFVFGRWESIQAQSDDTLQRDDVD